MSNEDQKAPQVVMPLESLDKLLVACAAAESARVMLGNETANYLVVVLPDSDGHAVSCKATATGVYLPPQIDPETGNLVEQYVPKAVVQDLVQKAIEDRRGSGQAGGKKRPARKKAAKKKAARKKAATRKAPANKKAAKK